MESILEKRYPLSADDYELYEEVGEGVSASVYRALCVPLNEIVAIKVLDLEKCNNDLDGVRREVQTMSLIDHPNLLRAHCSFTAGHCLWVVMPYMAGGSCLHIMKSSYPEGFEEPVIATLLRETLKALVYLHFHGHIHRDVKAGNILIDSNGAVKLADFGVSACMFDTGDRQRSRNTFVGTPCWMAPEVMQQLHGYDFKADIWSLGITALELAHGHAPFSKYPPMKVLLMTLQNAPPGLDYERDKRFSKSFKELVAACLVKDPKKRPSSEKLLKHHFFKHARSTDYVARSIIDGLSPLGERFRILKAKEADLLMQNKPQYEDKDQLSQQEYIRGISAWNFNLEDLKNQAALIQDDCSMEEQGVCEKQINQQDGKLPDDTLSGKAANRTTPTINEDEYPDVPDLDSSLASFPIKPLQALRGCFDVGEDDEGATTPDFKSNSEAELEQQVIMGPNTTEQDIETNGVQNIGRTSTLQRQISNENRRFSSGPMIAENSLSQSKVSSEENRDFVKTRYQSDRNYSGPILYRQKRDTNNHSSEDTADGAIVQRKGRFKVTSADLSPKGSTSPTSSNVTTAAVLPSLQCILQQNTMQREEIIKLIKYVDQSGNDFFLLVHCPLAFVLYVCLNYPDPTLLAGKQNEPVESAFNEVLQVSPKEKELQAQVFGLQQRIAILFDEWQKQKMINAQLERQLSSVSNKERE
ncbi:Serine/threonine-protein kinase fray2 [Linum grandiflorum]